MDSQTQTHQTRLNSAAIQSSKPNVDQTLFASVLQGLVECAVEIRTRDLIANILDVNAGRRFDGKKESCDIRALIEEALERHQTAAARKQIAFQCGISGGLWAHVNRAVLTTILDSLVSNAVKCSPVNGTVQIHALREKGSVVINIRDQSPAGANEASQQKLFQKIASLMAQSTDVELALAKKHSEGSAQWRSSQGFGSTFTLTLPVSSQPANSSEIADIKLLTRSILDLPETLPTFLSRN